MQGRVQMTVGMVTMPPIVVRMSGGKSGALEVKSG